MSFKLAIAGVALVFALAVMVEIWLKRGKTPRSLAERMGAGTGESSDGEKPLGMEATDLESVKEAQKLSEIIALKNHDIKFR